MGKGQVVAWWELPVARSFWNCEKQGGEAAEISSQLMTEWGLLDKCQGDLPCDIAQCLLLEQTSLRNWVVAILWALWCKTKRSFSLFWVPENLDLNFDPFYNIFVAKFNLSSNFLPLYSLQINSVFKVLCYMYLYKTPSVFLKKKK